MANDAKSGFETVKKQYATHLCLLFQLKTGQNPRFSELSIVPQIGKLVIDPLVRNIRTPDKLSEKNQIVDRNPVNRLD